MSRIRGIAVVTALLATIASTLSVYPNQLAYFNEAVGRPRNGYKHLLGSNLDWGQDLLYVREWIDAQQVGSDEVRIFSQAFEYNPRDLIGLDPRQPGTTYQWEIVSPKKLVELQFPREARIAGDGNQQIGSAMWVFRSIE